MNPNQWHSSSVVTLAVFDWLLCLAAAQGHDGIFFLLLIFVDGPPSIILPSQRTIQQTPVGGLLPPSLPWQRVIGWLLC
jgi:hypothetical protein